MKPKSFEQFLNSPFFGIHNHKEHVFCWLNQNFSTKSNYYYFAWLYYYCVKEMKKKESSQSDVPAKE